MVAFLLFCLAPKSPDIDRVLLIINQSSPDSVHVGSYYYSKRRIPRNQIVFINTDATEEVSTAVFESTIEQPVRKAVASYRKRFDFIVMTKGVPIRVKEGGYSVDALVAAMDMNTPKISKFDDEEIAKARSPYFGKNEPFSSKKFGFYLVTRLDGYTVADATAIIDRSMSAKRENGPFFFDEAENRNGGGYQDMQQRLAMANKVLALKGFDSELDTTKEFVQPEEPLMGYASWGSNDGAFDETRYRGIKFKAGALCETFVSTSGRTFKPTTGGQSLIADLIKSGVTGVKGYVSEPYTFALARPDILFDRYTSGRNLAESFYAASMVLKWKDIVIGDPLCSPYSTS